ncbi:hypothetical protein JCM19233_1977 [Vibrio astriarenae]|nr:hypothetical protein JCM19233_1977 [Vibrio sp. C7]
MSVSLSLLQATIKIDTRNLCIFSFSLPKKIKQIRQKPNEIIQINMNDFIDFVYIPSRK